MIGLAHDDKQLLEISFSILALHSLFLTPRYVRPAVLPAVDKLTHPCSIFSLLSLSPYYGTLVSDAISVANDSAANCRSCLVSRKWCDSACRPAVVATS